MRRYHHIGIPTTEPTVKITSFRNGTTLLIGTRGINELQTYGRKGFRNAVPTCPQSRPSPLAKRRRQNQGSGNYRPIGLICERNLVDVRRPNFECPLTKRS